MSTKDAWKAYDADGAWCRNESFDTFVRHKNIKPLRSEILKTWLGGIGAVLAFVLFYCAIPIVIGVALLPVLYVFDHAPAENIIALLFVAALLLLHGMGIGRSGVK